MRRKGGEGHSIYAIADSLISRAQPVRRFGKHRSYSKMETVVVVSDQLSSKSRTAQRERERDDSETLI